MDTPTLGTLSERLDRLEQENRWLRRLAALSLSGLAVCFAVAGGLRPSGEIAARRFVVQDAHGRARAVLGLQEDGQPGVALLDGKGRTQVALRTSDDHSSWLEFRDRDRLRMALSSSSSGASNLNLFDRDQLIGVGLGIGPDNASVLALNRGLGGFALNLDREGEARFSMTDPDGQIRGAYSMHRDGQLAAEVGRSSRFSLKRAAPAPSLDDPIMGQAEMGGGPRPMSQPGSGAIPVPARAAAAP